MSLDVCLSASTSYGNRSGGHPWLYLSWALGLQALGCRVTWLELITPAAAADMDDYVATAHSIFESVGLRARFAVCAEDGEPLPWDDSALYVALGDAAAAADVYLNTGYASEPGVVSRFRRTAYVDQDPGLFQLWVSQGKLPLAPHDVYFTIGETVGTPRARFPDCGLEWQHTRPPIALDPWPVTRAADDAAFTTVSNWWGADEWLEIDGEAFSNEKRTAFLAFLDLPARTPAHLELAITIGPWPVDLAERRRLEEHGWSVVPLAEADWGPDGYRAYVQRSRGEFSCAKPFYVRLETAMLHDRTLHYLASGKPAVVEHTGPSAILPDADGLFRVRTPEEAARALDVVESDYDGQCRRARELAEQFDARAVVARVLEQALA
jgi:hypothetical protein